MSKPVILVTGANGQLGKELQALSAFWPQFSFSFTTREELPVQDKARVRKFFVENLPSYCINCAAYTAVDKAETDPDTAFAVNATAPGILAAACREYNARFIHISTDYVFDGTSPVPYKEEDNTNPVNVYGKTKLKGEQLCMEANPHAIIIRTAWVYSSFGHNFVKTMLRLMKERPVINVVNDQTGAPTSAADLAQCILTIIGNTHTSLDNWHPGIYHYSNKGRITWYDFAVAIKELSGSTCQVNPIPTSQYPTPAKRPNFSLLDTGKMEATFGCTIPDWKDSLRQVLKQLKEKGDD